MNDGDDYEDFWAGPPVNQPDGSWYGFVALTRGPRVNLITQISVATTEVEHTEVVHTEPPAQVTVRRWYPDWHPLMVACTGARECECIQCRCLRQRMRRVVSKIDPEFQSERESLYRMRSVLLRVYRAQRARERGNE